MAVQPDLSALGRWWRYAPRRIRLLYALRDSSCMMVPLLVLIASGHVAGAIHLGLGAMYAGFADRGGAYQHRLAVMLGILVSGSAALFLGTVLPPHPGLAAVGLALIAAVGGMTRAFGADDASIGIYASILFLLGGIAPGTALTALHGVGWFALGVALTMLVHIVAWDLRPYHILQQQVAACLQSCAALVRVVGAALDDSGSRSPRVDARYEAAMAAVRGAEATLAALRLDASTPFFGRVELQLAAALHQAVAARDLHATFRSSPALSTGDLVGPFLDAWQKTLDAVAKRALQRGHAAIAMEPLDGAAARLLHSAAVPAPARASLQLALAHMATLAHPQLDAAPRPQQLIRRRRQPWRGRLRAAGAVLGAQLGLQSIVFRHALRVGVTAGAAQMQAHGLGLPEGHWLPLTVLLVLQPEFGATRTRIVQRVIGTLAGVVLAGVLLLLLGQTPAEGAALAVLAFAMFYFIRAHYGLGVTMMTPVIVLLIGLHEPAQTASLITARGVETCLGGALALLASYLLWPLWQGDRFPTQFADALAAFQAYCQQAVAPHPPGGAGYAALVTARATLGRTLDNCEALLQRMAAEPKRTRGGRGSSELVRVLQQTVDDTEQLVILTRDNAQARSALQAFFAAQLPLFKHLMTSLVPPVAGAAPSATSPAIGVVAADAPAAPWMRRVQADCALLARSVEAYARASLTSRPAGKRSA